MRPVGAPCRNGPRGPATALRDSDDAEALCACANACAGLLLHRGHSAFAPALLSGGYLRRPLEVKFRNPLAPLHCARGQRSGGVLIPSEPMPHHCRLRQRGSIGQQLAEDVEQEHAGSGADGSLRIQ